MIRAAGRHARGIRAAITSATLGAHRRRLDRLDQRADLAEHDVAELEQRLDQLTQQLGDALALLTPVQLQRLRDQQAARAHIAAGPRVFVQPDERMAVSWPTGRGPFTAPPEAVEGWVQRVNQLIDQRDATDRREDR